MTAEQFAKNLSAGATGWDQANIKSLARIGNTTPERVEEFFYKLEHADPASLRKFEKAGQQLGERIGSALNEAFGPLLRRYRT